MFEKFIEEIRNMPVTPPILVDMDISNNPDYSIEAFKLKILRNAEIPDNELYEFIRSHYRTILRSIYEMHDPAYIKYFTTCRFISTLTSVISQIPVDDQIRTYCNKIVYDYITFDNMVTDIADLMIGLSKVVNSTTILVLKGLGLSDEHATYIALAARSSDSDTVNIRRVNFIIATTLSDRWDNLDDESTMVEAEQLIIHIYEKTFTNLTYLFEITMFDIYDDNAPWMTEKISIMYSLTSMAVLSILNMMTLDNIRKVLFNYSLDYSVLVQNGRHPRFSLCNLSGDYNRINYVIDQMLLEGISVP